VLGFIWFCIFVYHAQ